MTPPLCPIPTPRQPRPKPLTRVPELCEFTLSRISFLVSSSQPGHEPYRVVIENGAPARCQCVGYTNCKKAVKTCSHCRVASEWLFTDAGMWRTYELIDAQLPQFKPEPSDPAIYSYNALIAIREHIERELGLEADYEEEATADDIAEWTDYQGPRRAYQYRDSKPSLWICDDLRDDSDPFAVAPVSAIPTPKPASYYEGEFSTWL